MSGKAASKITGFAGRVLLDTHALGWALREPELLGVWAVAAIRRGVVAARVASLWELLIQKSKPGALLAEPVAWWSHWRTWSRITKTRLTGSCWRRRSLNGQRWSARTQVWRGMGSRWSGDGMIGVSSPRGLCGAVIL